MKNIFNHADTAEIIDRISKLKHNTRSLWGKMEVDQMLAHCNVTYEMVYEDIHNKPNATMKLIMKLFFRESIVNEKPYKRNSRTSPDFIIKDRKIFDYEKERLIEYINRTLEIGEENFNGKESHSFGKLSSKEWNNMFYKHLDHHLKQFGV